MLCHLFEDSQTTAYMKNVDTSYINLLKTLLQMNSNISVTKKQTNKQKYIYVKIEFQNSIERLSFLCRITDI